jgi:arylsulfatase A-like enzyme
MKSIRLLLPTLLGLVAFSVAAQTDHPVPRRPNIILIVANSLGAGDLSCYGQAQFQTPNLDKLASNGVRFTHYSAGGTNSASAIASLMLGKASATADANTTLAGEDITIAQLLSDAGYFTCLIGEWDLGDEHSSGAPWRKGFDEFGGCFGPIAPYAGSIWRYEPARRDGLEPGINAEEPVYANADGKQTQYLPDFLTTMGMNFIKNHRQVIYNGYRPFFLQINYSVPGNGNCVVPSDAPFSEEPWPQPEKNRAAIISRFDGYLGQMLQQLYSQGQISNTVIFVTSDTIPIKAGGTDPKFFQENQSTNSLYVPLIAWWLNRIPAGRVSDTECSAQDFLPTACGLAFVKPPDKIDGVSILPAIFGQPAK